MRRISFLACLVAVPLLGGCSLAPFGHKPAPVPPAQEQAAKPADAGLKIAVDIVMAQLRKAEEGDLQAVQGAAPQIYQLAAALMPPARPSASTQQPRFVQPVAPPPAPAKAVKPAGPGADIIAASYRSEHAAPPSLPQGRSLLYAVHLGSYRHAARALRGFAELSDKAPELAALQARVEQVDLGPGKGVFERLKAGPFYSRAAAEALCGKLHAIGLYCSPADFTGRVPG